MEYKFEGVTAQQAVVGSYYPLSISYEEPPEQGTRAWRLDFMESPIQGVSFSGHRPTHAEMVHAFSRTLFPVLMIEVLMSVVGQLWGAEEFIGPPEATKEG